MKTLFATAAFIALTAPVFGQLADMIELPEEMAGGEESQYSDEELLETWGWLLAERFGLKNVNLSPSEVDSIAAGMVSHILGDMPPTNLQDSQLAIQDFFTKREQAAIENLERENERILKENKAKEIEFFDALFGLPDVQQLGSGLYYQIIEPGNDVKPDEDDMVVVNYEGRFLDNTVFDTTNGRKPAAFKLKEVIDGWTQGVQLIGEGGKVKLYVPAKLGYGDKPHGSVPPGSTLVFEISLLKVGLPEDPAADGVEVFDAPTDEAAGQE